MIPAMTPLPIVDQEWQPEDYFRALWNHRWLVLLITVLGLVVAKQRADREPRQFEATSRVRIYVARPAPIEFQEQVYIDPTSQNFLGTEYKMITSYPVLTRVIERLRLKEFPPFSESEDPVEILQGMIQVEGIRLTTLVDITVTGAPPVLVSHVANAVAEGYAEVNLEQQRQVTTGGAEWLRDEVAKADLKMGDARLALQAFMEEHGDVDFGEGTQNLALQTLQDLNQSLADHRKQLLDFSTQYLEHHPAVVALQAKLEALERAIAKQEQEILRMRRLAIEFDGLKLAVSTSEELYQTLLTRLQQMSVEEQLGANNVQVIRRARVPTSPIGPTPWQRMVRGALLGVGVGLGLSFWLERFNRTLRTRQEFERVLKLPFLGVVPRVAGRLGLLSATQAKAHTAAFEAIRAVRTTLEFLLPAEKSPMLIVTSALPREGKSILSVNLALAWQELGRRVIVIDGDLRRPSVHGLFHLPQAPGLSDYLNGRADLDQVIQRPAGLPTGRGRVAAITAGHATGNLADLLAGEGMRRLLEALRPQYEFILIDSPPVLAVTDAAMLSRVADGLIYLVRAHRTTHEAASVGIKRLQDVGATIIGAVLNGVDRTSGYYGYPYYQYYQRQTRQSSPPASGGLTPVPRPERPPGLTGTQPPSSTPSSL